MGAVIASGAISIIPPTNPVTATATTASVAGVTIYTVPAGRTFYCTGVSMVNPNPGAISGILDVDGTDVWVVDCNQYVQLVGYGQPIFVATAGQVIKVQSGGSNPLNTTIWGFYQ